MSSRCSETRHRPEPVKLSDDISAILNRIHAQSQERTDALQAVRSCVGCDKGVIALHLSGGGTYRTECPVMSAECEYGHGLASEFNAFASELMRGIGVPQRHLEKLSSMQQSIAVRNARMWGGKGFLVLFGDPGVGKSFGAAYAVYCYIRRGVTSLRDRGSWGTAQQAASGVLWACSKEICDDKARATAARSSRLLVMDDMGKEEDTKITKAVIQDVISRRYDAKLPTVITTEISVGEISARYGASVAQRIAEDTRTGGAVVDCGKVSMRLTGEVAP